jgi:exonuclease VII small subunit
MKMAGVEELIARYRAEVDRLKRRIESMESGRVRHETLEASGQWVETTSLELEDCKSRLAQWERLLEKLEPKPDDGIRPEDLNSENDG